MDSTTSDHQQTTSGHQLGDAYPTADGYGITCTCGRRWEWNADSDFTLDDMARDARAHAELGCDICARRLRPEDHQRHASCMLRVESWRRSAYALGCDAATAAASWTVDGNSDPGAARDLLRMLGEGDPAAYDHLPAAPNLSGEFADGPTPRSLADDIAGDALADLPESGAALVADILADAWIDGVDSTFESACEDELVAAAYVPTCSACGSERVQPPSGYRLWRCWHCGVAFDTPTRVDPDELADAAERAEQVARDTCAAWGADACTIRPGEDFCRICES